MLSDASEKGRFCGDMLRDRGDGKYYVRVMLLCLIPCDTVH